MNLRMTLSFILLCVSACSASIESPPVPPGNENPSKFLGSFDLDKLLENHKDLIVEEGDTRHSETAGFYTQPNGRKVHRIISLIDELAVPQDNRKALLLALEQDMKAAIQSEGYQVSGDDRFGVQPGDISDTGIIGFSLQYKLPNGFGVVNVWGVPGRGNLYNYIVTIYEY